MTEEKLSELLVVLCSGGIARECGNDAVRRAARGSEVACEIAALVELKEKLKLGKMNAPENNGPHVEKVGADLPARTSGDKEWIRARGEDGKN